MTAFTAGSAGEEMTVFKDKESEGLTNFIGNTFAEQLDEDLEFLNELYDDFDQEAYLNGQLAPVFFGSAINNFGVQELLDYFLKSAPSPVARPTQARMVEPLERSLPASYLRSMLILIQSTEIELRFLRICSGVFERNTFYMHTRINKLRFSNPTSFMASKKSIVDMAFPGDVVGLYDAGNFKIGDTLTEGEELFFKGIPSFSPEIFKEVVNRDPMKSKQLDKGIRQLSDEGVAQLFIHPVGQRKRSWELWGLSNLK